MGEDLDIWFKATLAGFIAWRDQDTAAAAAFWDRAAASTAGGGVARATFHAVACANAAVALGTSGAAARADGAWAEVMEAAGLEDIPLPARSSVFHLRLASQHAPAFSAFLRRRYLALAGLGRWLAEANGLAQAGARESLDAHLRTYDPAVAVLPAFLERGVQIARAGVMDRPAALALLTNQIDHIRAFRATTALPETLWTQLEAALGFCAFAPLADGLAGPGDPFIGETDR